MFELTALARLAMLLFSGGLLAIVFTKLFIGEIPLAGLLRQRDSAGVFRFSPSRAQLLVLTLFVSGDYLLSVVRQVDSGSLPKPSEWMLSVFAGSQVIYLAGKASGLSAVRRILSNLTRK